MAVFAVALLFSFGREFCYRVSKTIIVLSATFSAMVLAQAAIIWFNPDVLGRFVLGYTTSTQAEKVDVGHPLEYLGFTTPGAFKIAGHELTRFRSFTSEPSAVVSNFLAPGILALGYKGLTRAAAIPILVFSVVLSASGTVWLSIALGVVSYFLLFAVGREKLIASFPLVGIFVWYSFIARTDVVRLMTAVSQALAPLEPYEGAFNKIVSGTARLSVAAGYLQGWRSYLWGAPVVPTGGLLLHMFLYAGVVGLTLCIVVGYNLLRSAALCFRREQGLSRLMAALFFGLFVQVMGFSEFGWMTMPGFMMLVLIQRRLEVMA